MIAAVGGVNILNAIDDSRKFDENIGTRIKLARNMRQVSQRELDRNSGFSSRKTEQYEKGMGNISSYHLWRVSQCLNVKPSYFFEGVEDAAPMESMDRQDVSEIIEFAASPTGIMLVSRFRAIKNDDICNALLDLMGTPDFT